MKMTPLVLLFALAGGAMSAASYDRLYVFGDSYSDNGAGYLDGNGPTAVAYMADRLGFSLLPANAANAAGKSLNFAVSGARTGSGAGRKVKDALLGFGMNDQVEEFSARVKSGAIQFKPETTLFFLAGGLNDRSLPTETTVANLKGHIKKLYALGGRHFMVATLPTAIPAFSEVGKRLNPALQTSPFEVALEVMGATVSLSRWGMHFDEVMNNPGQYGITNTKDACAGRAIFDQDPKPCAAPASYYYYHQGHPSTAVHKVVGEKLYEEVAAGPK